MLPLWVFATAAAALADVDAADASSEPTTPLVRPASPHPSPRKLHGRFLHITDMHPDQHYRAGTSVSSHCHRNPPRKEHARANYFGVPFSECDSPWSLVNLTLDYIAEEWAHNIDFVIWTGDNARHDIDNRLPRSPSEIYQLNRIVAARMEHIFKGMPVVPSIGNNDIWPHNIMAAGPNSITNEFSDIWRPFIPFSQYQEFQHGGYYAVDLIPDRLAAVSLNTMYWYDSNKAVGGCVPHDEDDAGNLQFDWLEVQLDMYREKGMQVMLTGHVPPGPGLYFPDCYFRYGQLSLRFQDTIVAHLYGHMNIDHFFWIDIEDVMEEPRPPRYSEAYAREELHTALHKDFKYLNELNHVHYDDYVAINVGPSVLPEYLPSFRIYQYNITGFNGKGSVIPPGAAYRAQTTKGEGEGEGEGDADGDGEENDEEEKKRKRGSKRKHGHRHLPKPDCTQKENENRWACRPWGPRHASPDSPSRTNKLFSLLGYAQYYLPDVDTANATHPPKYKLEYLTWPLESLHPPNDTALAAKWKAPIPRHLLPRSLRNVSRTRSRFAPYRMPDLTIPRWITLARELVRRRKLWDKFVGYMYMGEELDEEGKARVWGEDDDVEDGPEEYVLNWEEDEEESDWEREVENAWEVPESRQWTLPTGLYDNDNEVLPS